MHEIRVPGVPPLDPAALLHVDAAPNRPRRVRIGVSGNRGGHTRELCAGCAVAVETWLETAGAPYGIELVWEEDAFDEAHTRRAASRLVEAGCVAVVGHLSSSAALPAAEVYHEAGIPFFAPGSTHPGLTARGFWNVLRLCGRDEPMASQLAAVVETLERVRPAIVWQEITYGRTLAALIERSLGERGVRPVARIPWNGRLLPADAAALERSDAVLFAGTYQAAAGVVKELRASGYRGLMVMGDDAFIAELPRLVEDAAEDAYVVSTRVNHAHPEYEPFRRRYVSRAGLEPGAYAATSYLSMKLLLQGLDALLQGGARTGVEKIRAAAAAEETLLGRLRFARSGDLVEFPWAVYRIERGEFVILSTATEG